jgi:hypothetical protein
MCMSSGGTDSFKNTCSAHFASGSTKPAKLFAGWGRPFRCYPIPRTEHDPLLWLQLGVSRTKGKFLTYILYAGMPAQVLGPLERRMQRERR